MHILYGRESYAICKLCKSLFVLMYTYAQLYSFILFMFQSPSSNESSADSTPAKKEPTKADIMAEKAAAKAAQAAARERQKAAADAAALDKMIGI